MSDPVQNSDVEDVLSSIRRLVSEDDRPKAQVPVQPGTDRLVLTPSLRVAEPAPASVEEARADDEPDTDPRDVPDTDDEAKFEARAYSDDADTGAIEDAWAERQDEAVVDDRAEPDAEPAEPEADAAETDPEPAESDAETEAAPAQTEAEPAEPEADPVEADADTGAPETDLGAEEADEYTSPQSLSAKIAALEAVIARRDDHWEPDTAGADDYAGTADADMTWEDTPPRADAPELPEIFAADEDVLDEDALRDLVAEIVREELQGALGERITRNVRKLVRREIHRALAAQELD